MRGFAEFIEEKRKNPELNPKKFVDSELQKYKGQENIFITFRDPVEDSAGQKNKKVGINPKSGFSTPNGIYAYPLEYSLDEIENEGVVRGALPFASDRPHLYILRPKSGTNIQVAQEYTEEDLKEDTKKLDALGPNGSFIQFFNRRSFSQNYDEMSVLRMLLDYIKKMSQEYNVIAGEESSKEFFNISIKYFRVDDVGPEEINKLDLISEQEKYIFDFFKELGVYEKATKEHSENVERMKSYAEQATDLFYRFHASKHGLIDSDYVNDVFFKQENARKNTPFGRFWYMTWKLSNTLHLISAGETRLPQNIWNGLLRGLGYHGFVDYGGGYIHTNEETQAVFLSSTFVDVVQEIDNKESKIVETYDNFIEFMYDHIERETEYIRNRISSFMNDGWKLKSFTFHINGKNTFVKLKRNLSDQNPKDVDRLFSLMNYIFSKRFGSWNIDFDFSKEVVKLFFVDAKTLKQFYYYVTGKKIENITEVSVNEWNAWFNNRFTLNRETREIYMASFNELYYHHRKKLELERKKAKAA